MHNRSVAENFTVYTSDNELFNGTLSIDSGKLNQSDIYIEGASLLIGADLTGKAFSRSIFGAYGQYIVAIGLLLFAFSTAIAWSYYGDRATVHLFGERWVFHYRVIYVGAFFLASIIDTKIVWDIATVIGPIATVPNLIAILLLRREIKEIQKNYTTF
jgi:AGCS family alanine or glycine:cation symporter